jgi:hypothetical protein
MASNEGADFRLLDLDLGLSDLFQIQFFFCVFFDCFSFDKAGFLPALARRETRVSVLLCCCSCCSWGRHINQNTALLYNFTMLSAYCTQGVIAPLHAALPGSPCPTALARQPLPGSPCPAALARQPCPAALARQPCPTALQKYYKHAACSIAMLLQFIAIAFPTINKTCFISKIFRSKLKFI